MKIPQSAKGPPSGMCSQGGSLSQLRPPAIGHHKGKCSEYAGSLISVMGQMHPPIIHVEALLPSCSECDPPWK